MAKKLTRYERGTLYKQTKGENIHVLVTNSFFSNEKIVAEFYIPLKSNQEWKDLHESVVYRLKKDYSVSIKWWTGCSIPPDVVKQKLEWVEK